MDKRHLETLVREDLNYVKVNKSDENGEYLKHDIVPYNRVRPIVEKSSKLTPFNKQVIGKTLGKDYLHFTAGSEITPEGYNTIKIHEAVKDETEGIDRLVTVTQKLSQLLQVV